MAETIEALLEENLGQVQALNQTSTALQQSFQNHVVPLDKKIDVEVTPRIDSALSEMKAFQEATEKLETIFDRAETESSSRFGNLEAAVTRSENAMEAAAGAAEKILSNLETETAQAFRAMEANGSSVDTEFDNIEELASQFKTLIAEKAKDIVSRGDVCVKHFSDKFGMAKSRFETIQSRLSEYDTQRTAQLAKVKAEMDRALAEAKTQIEAIVSRIQAESSKQVDQTLANLRAAVAEQITTEVTTIAAEMKKTNTDFQDDVATMKRRVSEVKQKADGALEELRASDPDLDHLANGL